MLVIGCVYELDHWSSFTYNKSVEYEIKCLGGNPCCIDCYVIRK